MDDPLLRVERLDVSFRAAGGGWTAIVEQVELTVARGETVCLVGESGSGKSVTALALMGLLDPKSARVSGTVTLAGRDLTALDERGWREVRGRDVAMIFQEPMSSLNPVLRIGDQIAEAVLLHDRERADGKAAARRAVELLAMVGIPDPERRARDYPHQLSGGMRQRVMIAIALSCNPRLLIADEPTTALDVTIQAQILELIGELRERLGMAVLLITHDLGVVAETADRVAVMYAGRVVERASAAALFGAPGHPYTSALLRAIPELEPVGAGVGPGAGGAGAGAVVASAGAELYAIPGTVPSPGRRPRGCRFAPRCEHRFDACAQEPPPFAADGHLARCWLRDPDRRSPDLEATR